VPRPLPNCRPLLFRCIGREHDVARIRDRGRRRVRSRTGAWTRGSGRADADPQLSRDGPDLSVRGGTRPCEPGRQCRVRTLDLLELGLHQRQLPQKARRGRQRDAACEDQARGVKRAYPTLPTWFARTRRRATDQKSGPSPISWRIGIPRVLKLWSTHQFCRTLRRPRSRSAQRRVSSDTSKGRAGNSARVAARWTALPVKCIAGHYGELSSAQREKLDVVFSPMIYNRAVHALGHVRAPSPARASWRRPENSQGRFIKERDVFAEHGCAMSPVRLARRAQARPQAALRPAARGARRADV